MYLIFSFLEERFIHHLIFWLVPWSEKSQRRSVYSSGAKGYSTNSESIVNRDTRGIPHSLEVSRWEEKTGKSLRTEQMLLLISKKKNIDPWLLCRFVHLGRIMEGFGFLWHAVNTGEIRFPSSKVARRPFDAGIEWNLFPTTKQDFARHASESPITSYYSLLPILSLFSVFRLAGPASSLYSGLLHRAVQYRWAYSSISYSPAWQPLTLCSVYGAATTNIALEWRFSSIFCADNRSN